VVSEPRHGRLNIAVAIQAVRIAKEELRKLLELSRTGPDRRQIAAQLAVFYTWCARADLDELNTLATTVDVVASDPGIHRHRASPTLERRV
jgi:hypothetical protein